MNISFIIPSRDNLKYLKWSYESIRKNQGNHTVQICVADDASTDGTREWLEDQASRDSDLTYIVNGTGQRCGHTILYDRLVNEVAKYDLCIIYHADMYLCPGALDAIEEHMYGRIPVDRAPGGWEVYKKEKTIVSLTRIEPPLHPLGPEKIILDCGTEPEEFNEDMVLEEVMWAQEGRGFMEGKPSTTEGIFAPWAFWKSDFQEIDGHDKLFAPQSKEDSDIFNRFHLNGTHFIQTWEGFVYHMTCRGSRYNPTLTTPGTNSPEWEAQNLRSARNFVRKWGSYVKHDEYMKPIVPPKYDVGIVLTDANIPLLRTLEPWCANIQVDMDTDVQARYIGDEQPNTLYDLSTRIFSIHEKCMNDVTVFIDGKTFNNQDMQYISLLSEILQDSGVVGEKMEIGNLTIVINNLRQIESDLIICEN